MSLIEVEAKFRVDDAGDVRRRLDEMGASAGASVRQSDEYFAHPQRDFSETNEAFRLRTVGDENRLTYKGPLLDTTTKSRKEIEVRFASGGEERRTMRELLAALGFRSVRVVEKQRRTGHLGRDGFDFEVCLDHVSGLGDFVELETCAAEETWEEAREALVRLAGELELTRSERRSYLELLLEATEDRSESGG